MTDEQKPNIPDLPKAMKPNILGGLPQFLKDPENYQKIRKFLFDILASRCSHSDPLEWTTCKKCVRRIHEHADAIRKLGFTSPAQYYAWRKVHEHIERRVKLEKYNS